MVAMKNLHWRCIHIIWYNGDSRGMTWRILCSQHHGWFRLVEIIIRDRRAPHLLMKIMAMTKVLDGQTWWIFWSKDCSASWAGRHLLSSPWRLLLMLEISICWKAILALPSLSPLQRLQAYWWHIATHHFLYLHFSTRKQRQKKLI